LTGRAGLARRELVQVALDLFPEAGRLAAVAGEALGGLLHLAQFLPESDHG
jgi:hypothetical protein